MRSGFRQAGQRALELDDRAIDLVALAAQELELLDDLLAAELEAADIGCLPGDRALLVLGGEHGADLDEREAALLALQDQRKTSTIALRIDARQARAGGRDQSARFVEAQGTQRDAEIAGEIADGELPGLSGGGGYGAGFLC